MEYWEVKHVTYIDGELGYYCYLTIDKERFFKELDKLNIKNG
jgi:hypothetical protein